MIEASGLFIRLLKAEELVDDSVVKRLEKEAGPNACRPIAQQVCSMEGE